MKPLPPILKKKKTHTPIKNENTKTLNNVQKKYE